MTPKEKAKELVEKFINDTWDKTGHHLNTLAAKECAIIHINGLIEQNGEIYLFGFSNDYYTKKNSELFELKDEIEKL